MKWFDPVPKTAEELKKAYRTLTLKHHPDVVPMEQKARAEQDMKEINNEFDELHSLLYNVHESSDGKVYTDNKADAQAAQEAAEEFKEVIDKLAGMDGIEVEICGTWVWVGGDTYSHRADIKAAGFKWASQKRKWYWHGPDYVKKGKRQMNMSEIRWRYGSIRVDVPEKREGFKKLAG